VWWVLRSSGWLRSLILATNDSNKEKFMLAIKGIYQNEQLFLLEKVPFTQPVTVIVTFLDDEIVTPKSRASYKSISSTVANDKLLGLFAHDAELIDEITESAMHARENDPLRCSDG
jgi:hypothetical protein